MPALTLTKDQTLSCGYHVHQHSDSCYKTITDESGTTRKTLVCGQADWVVHEHNSDCYAEIEGERILVCELPEIKAHQHTAACYNEQNELVCKQAELHKHSKDCYEEGHEGDASYLMCGKLELLEHVHGGGCIASGSASAEEILSAAEKASETRLAAAKALISEGSQFESILQNEEETSQNTAGQIAEIKEKLAEEAADEAEDEQASDDASNVSKSDEELDDQNVSKKNVSDDEKQAVNSGKSKTRSSARKEAGEPSGDLELITLYETDYPAQTFEEHTDEISVAVIAEEGTFPAGTTMRVSDVHDEAAIEMILEQAEGTVRQIHAADITFYYNDEEIEPAKQVKVVMTPAQSMETDEPAPQIVHLEDAGDVRMIQPAADAVVEDIVVNTDVSVADETVVFEADSFSVYALVYTVDFSYESDGKTYEYSMDGGSTVKLSELFELLEIERNVNGNTITGADLIDYVQTVSFSDETLVKVTSETEGVFARKTVDWNLENLQAFDSNEKLTITFADGEIISIEVTDAQAYVAGNGSGSITVSKQLDYQSGMNKINGTRLYFALVKNGEYVQDSNGNIYYKEMFMQGDTLNPSSVRFTGLEDGDYEVWEMHGDPNNGSLNRSYDGMLLNNDTVEIDKIRVVANSNGQQNANGLYNNNATIKNGSSESMTFRNTYKPSSDKTSFEANKVWMDRKEKVTQAPNEATIVFSLYKEVGGVTTPTGKTIVLNGVSDNDGEANPWQAVFSDLPKTENGQTIKYKVKETTGWPDYYVCKNKGKNLMGENEYLETSGGTIYNRHLLATIQIQKHFDIQPNKYSKADWAEMLAKKQLSLELTNETTHETWYFTLDDTFSQSGQLFYLDVPDMQAGHYVLKEYRYKGLITDRKWDRGITIYERDINPGDNMDNPLFEMEVQNWYVAGQDEPEGAYIRALKVWDDLDNFDGIRPSSVTVRLKAEVNGESYQLPDITNPVRLSEENDWNTGKIWYNLPIEDDKGNRIEYSVSEENVPDGYTCTTAISENGTDKSYTFTNKHRPQGTGKIKLKKIVEAPAGAAIPDTYYFTIQDSDGLYWTGHSTSGPDGYYTAVPVPIEISSNTGEAEIELPVGRYTIAEIRDGIQIDGYSLTVTGEGAFDVRTNQNEGVVVTNHYEEQIPDGGLRVVKKWQDEGGNPVSGEGRSATVRLRRYHYVSDGGGTATGKTVTVTVVFPGTGQDGWNPKSSTSVSKHISGESATVSIRILAA